MVINWQKSDLVPKQQIRCLGKLLDTIAKKAFPAILCLNILRKLQPVSY